MTASKSRRHHSSEPHLPQRKIDLDIQRNVHRFAAASSRPELPLLESLNSVLIQTQSQDRAAPSGSQSIRPCGRWPTKRRSLDTALAAHPLNSWARCDTHRGSADSATNPEESTARSPAFTRTDARLLCQARHRLRSPVPIPPPVPGPLEGGPGMPSGSPSWAMLTGGQLCELGNDDCWLNRQNRLRVHNLRCRRGELPIRESRQLAQRSRSFFPPSTSTTTARLFCLWRQRDIQEHGLCFQLGQDQCVLFRLF